MKQLLTALFLFITASLFAQNSLNKAPHKDSVAKYIGNGVYLTVTGCIGDEAQQKIVLYFTLTNPSKSHQKIKIDPWNDVPVGAYDNDGNQFPFGAVNLGNQNGFGQVETELPTNLKVKGFITFINIHNKPKKLAHITIPVSSGNWPSSSDVLNEIIEINNIAVNWKANTFPYEETEDNSKNIDFTKDGFNKSICNGLDFYYTGCNGDAAAQTTTVYFVIANNNKSNQKITIDPYSQKRAFAFDNIGNNYAFDKLTITNESSEGQTEFLIPTGLFVKGSITYKNILPVAKSLGIVNFNVRSENSNGSGGEIEEAIQLTNLKIDWAATKNPNNNFTTSKKTAVNASFADNDVSIVPNKTRTLENNLDLIIEKAEGDSVAQTVTIYYAIANPRKPNQKVNIQNLSSDPIIAFDNNGNQYKVNQLSIEDNNSSDEVSAELPSGLSVNGSITFINVFPIINNFSLIKMPIKTSNRNADDNGKVNVVYLKNLKIKWIKLKPKDVKSDEENTQSPQPTQPTKRRRY